MSEPNNEDFYFISLRISPQLIEMVQNHQQKNIREGINHHRM